MRCVWCCAPITADDIDQGRAKVLKGDSMGYREVEHVVFYCDPNYDDSPWNSSGWLDRGHQ